MPTGGLGVASKKCANVKVREGRAKQTPCLWLSLVGSPKPRDPGEGLKKVALRRFFRISREMSRVTGKFNN